MLFNSTIVLLLIERLDVLYICLFKVSVYSVPEKKEHTEYALDTASKLLEFYNHFFEIDYPLKKLGEYTQTLEDHLILICLFCFSPLFKHPDKLPLSFVRLGSHSRLPGWSHGELGTHHFQRDQPAGGKTVLLFGKTSSCLCHSP